jgi:PhnB protein
MPGPNNKIGHAEIQIGRGLVMLADEFPEMGQKSPKTVGGSPVTVTVYVEDVDQIFKHAIDAGAREVRAVEDQFYGDRSGGFEDPFGHYWAVQTHVEDVEPGEMEKRMNKMLADGSWGES